MADLFNFEDLPCSIEAEQALLGCILKQPECFKDIADKVKVPLMTDRELSYFKELKKLANATRKWAFAITRDARHSDSDGDMAKESDWWYNLILMVEDRTGTDELKTKQLLEWISTMPSQLHIFEHIRAKDFVRLV